MIILCSMAAWRDRTLLFVSLPCIALFGLVGTFDTYPIGTGMFFAFLVSSGVLYARVHLRSMSRRAILAGEPDPQLLLRGPWKWMAGPEWAFASGFAIMLLSLLGAPVIQQSVQQVTQQVRVNLPQPAQNQPQQPQRQRAQPETSIGRGPNNPSPTPVFEVEIDRPRLLRSSEYSVYTGNGWSTGRVPMSADNPLTDYVDSRSDRILTGPNGGYMGWKKGTPISEPIAESEIVKLVLRPRGLVANRLLAPGPVVEVDKEVQVVTFFASGPVELENSYPALQGTTYYAAVPKDDPGPEVKAEVQEILAPLYSDSSPIPATVRRFAARATAGVEGDFARAMALKRAITGQARYNLNAAATPPNADPVEHFLFESKEGYCDLFASSMVLGARSLGLPARYVTGWLVDSEDRLENGYLVRERNYHAWAEVYFQGYGWLPFDPTEGAEEVPGGGVGETPRDVTPFWTRGWFLPLLASLIVAAFAFPIAKMLFLRARAYLAPEGRIKNELVGAYNSFHMSIEKLTGSPKRFSQTLGEYVTASGPVLGDLKEEAASIIASFDEAMFGAERLDQEGVRALGARVKSFRAQVADRAKTAKAAR
jgi:transglutaminase-like putative cysteine protease